MRHIPGAILAVFIFAWLTFLGADLVKGQQSISVADSYLADICKEISESNFSPEVIDACGTQANENGYDMTITLYSESGTKATYSYADGANHAGAPDEYLLAEIQLDYDYKVPFLQINKQHTVRGTVK